jgi:hypothetical protein
MCADKDSDQVLTEEEFAAPPTGDVDEKWADAETKYLAVSDVRASVWRLIVCSQERRKEFKTMIDANHDGRVDVLEMMAYMNPRNPLHAKAEVSDRRRRR